jgi:hypothetical protein
MLHYFKFRQDLFAPQPAKEIYIKRGKGRGWPEECPPIRAANAFGFDLLANFDLTFIHSRAGWRVEEDIVIESDFGYSPDEASGGDDSPGDDSGEDDPGEDDSGAAPFDGDASPTGGTPLRQQYAWFWEKGQKLPHVISDNVYAEIDNQVKVSSFLFLKTDPNELLLMTDPPNLSRPFRAMSAIIDTDWYPASYPWHVVLELDRREKKIMIAKGDPICRIIPVRRDTYFAGPMTETGFDDFFTRGQQWLITHGQVQHEGTVDITRTYVRQQLKSKFVVLGE